MVGIKAGLATMFVIVVAWAPAWADQGGQYQGMHMWEGGWHGWLMGPLMMIISLVIPIMVVVLLLRWFGVLGQGVSPAPHEALDETSLDILQKRFAQGVIDQEEFEDRKRHQFRTMGGEII